MFLLPPSIRRLFQKKHKTDDDFRIFFSDQALVVTIRKLASQQGRSEDEVLTEITKAGWDFLFNKDVLLDCWDSLTDREQEVLALVCLGYRNHEVADILVISHETIKKHLQHIFQKFELRSVKELRHAWKDWSFKEWWDSRHP